MTSPLHKVPRGLLELLRGRTLGRTPDELGGIVTPTIETTAYYAADILLTSANTATTAAVPILSNYVTTAAFRVYAVGAVFVNGAAAGANMFLSWGIQVGGLAPTPNTNTELALGQIALGTTVAGQAYHGGSVIDSYYALPGSILWARVNGTAAGVDHQLNVVALIEFSSI